MNKLRLCIKCFFIVLLSIILLGVAVISLFSLGERVAIGFERISPNYDKIDISQILSKPSLTDEDYDLIYRQTGLTRLGADSVIANTGINGVLEFQNALFDEYTVKDAKFAPFCHYYTVGKQLPMAPLQNGDIIVSSSTEFSFWSVGHCAMIIDSENGLTLEAIGIGSDSKLGYLSAILRRGNFIVLRPKLDKEKIDSIVSYASENMVGLKYDPTIGILSRKYVEDIKYTHCAHIFWYAFYEHGLDIDSNGGPVVTPKDISWSEHFDIVQVSGFDLDKLWD